MIAKDLKVGDIFRMVADTQYWKVIGLDSKDQKVFVEDMKAIIKGDIDYNALVEIK
jgi:hypothetical protein